MLQGSDRRLGGVRSVRELDLLTQLKGRFLSQAIELAKSSNMGVKLSGDSPERIAGMDLVALGFQRL